MALVRVAALSELPDGSVMGVEAGGQRICLAHCDGEVYAFSDNCSHRDFPLSNACEWHGAAFDIRTGRPLCPPAITPIRVYECRVEDGAILVEVATDK